ncbi:MAG: hypothetical protein JST75_17120 [Bacteroidetes bacterium]|nr:hypothetical protein [Bacteroidota bacterium]
MDQKLELTRVKTEIRQMISNHLLSIGKPVPKAIVQQLRIRESTEYREALAKSGKKRMEILWAGIKSRSNGMNSYEFFFIFN